MEWLKNLSRAIEYLENNLQDKISYEEAAKIACCSVYYFQRLFSYVSGVSLSEYIRRRRMTQAAFEIQQSNEKITDIAFKYGYSCVTSFNRAFQQVHGVPPTSARTKGVVLQSFPPIRFSVSVMGGESMNYRIENKDAFRMVGVRTKLTEEMDKNQMIVPKFWQEQLQGNLVNHIQDLADSGNKQLLGVTAYLGPDNIYYYIGVISEKEAPTGMNELIVPKGSWAIFESEGRFKESIQQIYKKFITEWLPFSGYEYAGLPDIEVYPITNKHTSGGHAQVWISIKKEGEN